MRILYSILFYLALPYVFLRLLWRSRNAPDYRKRWDERLGFCPYKLDQCIWVHAVSLGETIAAVPFIKALKKRYPDLPLLVTNMTPTGAARVKAVFGDTVLQCYIPYDLPGADARFLDRINPIIAIIMETELWPNMVAACKKRKIPIMIANARLSEKSARGYERVSSLTKKMLADVNVIAAQAEADAARFIRLGAEKESVKITGNLKFDLELAQDLAAKSVLLRTQLGSDRLIWIAASTHPGEDEIILSAHQMILNQISNALLILVPRHPERFDAMCELAKQKGFNTVRRSHNEPCTSATQVYLGDTMGEMMLMYSVSDVAFVGGSFVSVGGHNMLEPAVLQKPILTGPYLFNFAEISEMLFNVHGMLKVHDANELAAAVIDFFKDETKRKQIGQNAESVVIKNRGALAKQIQLALSLF